MLRQLTIDAFAQELENDQILTDQNDVSVASMEVGSTSESASQSDIESVSEITSVSESESEMPSESESVSESESDTTSASLSEEQSESEVFSVSTSESSEKEIASEAPRMRATATRRLAATNTRSVQTSGYEKVHATGSYSGREKDGTIVSSYDPNTNTITYTISMPDSASSSNKYTIVNTKTENMDIISVQVNGGNASLAFTQNGYNVYRYGSAANSTTVVITARVIDPTKTAELDEVYVYTSRNGEPQIARNATMQTLTWLGFEDAYNCESSVSISCSTSDSGSTSQSTSQSDKISESDSTSTSQSDSASCSGSVSTSASASCSTSVSQSKVHQLL